MATENLPPNRPQSGARSTTAIVISIIAAVIAVSSLGLGELGLYQHSTVQPSPSVADSRAFTSSTTCGSGLPGTATYYPPSIGYCDNESFVWFNISLSGSASVFHEVNISVELNSVCPYFSAGGRYGGASCVAGLLAYPVSIYYSSEVEVVEGIPTNQSTVSFDGISRGGNLAFVIIVTEPDVPNSLGEYFPAPPFEFSGQETITDLGTLSLR